MTPNARPGSSEHSGALRCTVMTSAAAVRPAIGQNLRDMSVWRQHLAGRQLLRPHRKTQASQELRNRDRDLSSSVLN